MRFALSLMLVLVLAAPAVVRAEMTGGLTVGDIAPEGKVRPVGGAADVSLGSAQGQKVLLFVIFQTTCPHCQLETKALNRLQSELDANKVSILAAALAEKEEKVLRFRDRFAVKYPLAFDQNGDLQRPFNIIGVPTYFILDKTRKIRYQGNAESYDTINAQLQKVLAE